MGRSIDALSDKERVAYYRSLALEALEHARQSTSDDHTAAYLEIAQCWTKIANDVERVTTRQADLASQYPMLQQARNGRSR